MRKLLFILMFFAIPTFGQGAFFGNYPPVISSSGRPVAGAQITVCAYQTSPATPCTPTTLIYSDVGLTIPITQPLKTDGLGNYSFWTTPGNYTLCITGPGINGSCGPITVGGSSGGSGPPFLGPNPWFDVTNAAYGAKCDGVTDDTAAFQAAFNAAAAAPGGTVYIPWNSPVTLPITNQAGCVIKGGLTPPSTSYWTNVLQVGNITIPSNATAPLLGSGTWANLWWLGVNGQGGGDVQTFGEPSAPSIFNYSNFPTFHILKAGNVRFENLDIRSFSSTADGVNFYTDSSGGFVGVAFVNVNIGMNGGSTGVPLDLDCSITGLSGNGCFNIKIIGGNFTAASTATKKASIFLYGPMGGILIGDPNRRMLLGGYGITYQDNGSNSGTGLSHVQNILTEGMNGPLVTTNQVSAGSSGASIDSIQIDRVDVADCVSSCSILKSSSAGTLTTQGVSIENSSGANLLDAGTANLQGLMTRNNFEINPLATLPVGTDILFEEVNNFTHYSRGAAFVGFNQARGHSTFGCPEPAGNGTTMTCDPLNGDAGFGFSSLPGGGNGAVHRFTSAAATGYITHESPAGTNVFQLLFCKTGGGCPGSITYQHGTGMTLSMEGQSFTFPATGGVLCTTATCMGGGSNAWSALTASTNSNAGSFISTGNTWDFSGSTLFKLRVGSGLTGSVNGDLGYNTIDTNWHIFSGGVDNVLPVLPGSITAINNNCVKFVFSASHVSLNNAGICPQTISAVTSNFLTSYTASTGVFTQGQASFNDITSGAIANGTTATTQTLGDNTTKVATDAFVIANAGTATPGGATNTIQYNNAGVFGGIGLPTAVTGLTYSLTSTGGLGAWAIQGRPVTSAITTTYTFNGAGASGTGSSADQGFLVLGNPSAARVYTIPQAGTTGFANNPFWALFNENATNAITLTPTTSTINSGSTALVPPLGFSVINSDNTNYFAATIPTYGAFPNCPTGGLGITASTGIFICNTISSGGPTIQTNTVNNTSQTTLNMSTSTTNAVGLTVTPTNPSGGVETYEITGASYTGNAATATKWATARNLAGNSVDGSVNVAFANKFIVQGTSDTGLSAAQFLGALATGLLKNTTTTGVLSIATSSDILGVCTTCVTSAASLTNNVIVKGAGSQGVQLSSITDNGTTVSSTEPVTATSFAAGTSPPTCAPGTAGGVCAGEGTAVTAVSAVDDIWADSTSHTWMAHANGGSPAMVVLSLPGSINLASQTASIATATLCAAAAGACNQAGLYHVHFAMEQTGTACTANTTNGVLIKLTWTDSNGTAHSAQTIPLITNASLTGFATSGIMAYNATTLGAFASGDIIISSNGSVIQYATTYQNCTTGTATYEIRGSVVRLQ